MGRTSTPVVGTGLSSNHVPRNFVHRTTCPARRPGSLDHRRAKRWRAGERDGVQHRKRRPERPWLDAVARLANGADRGNQPRQHETRHAISSRDRTRFHQACGRLASEPGSPAPPRGRASNDPAPGVRARSGPAQQKETTNCRQQRLHLRRRTSPTGLNSNLAAIIACRLPRDPQSGDPACWATITFVEGHDLVHGALHRTPGGGWFCPSRGARLSPPLAAAMDTAVQHPASGGPADNFCLETEAERAQRRAA